MTRKSCAVGMRNAILRNHLRYITFLLFAGDQNVQDGSASFTGWSDSNYGLGEADEQVLGLLLAESAFDPLLDNIDWGDDSYSGGINLNPD